MPANSRWDLIQPLKGKYMLYFSSVFLLTSRGAGEWSMVFQDYRTGLCLDILNLASTYFPNSYEVAQLVEALRYKPEGRGFDSQLCH